MKLSPFLTVETHRASYAVMLSSDRRFYAPFNVLPYHCQMLSGLFAGQPNVHRGAYQVMLDCWEALGCTPKTLAVRQDPTYPTILRGLVHLVQKSKLGRNVVDVGCTPVDVVVLATLLKKTVALSDEAAPLACVRVENPSAPDETLYEEVRRSLAILETSREMEALLAGR